MKKIFVSALMIASTMMTYAQDITADELLDNYFENIGGREAWGELEGYKMSAEVEQMGMAIPVEVYSMQGGKNMIKYSVQGMEIVQVAFDGEVSWGTNFMSMKPEKSDAEETENTKRNSKDFPDPLYNYKDKGYSVEMAGIENIDGVECYKLLLTKTPVLVDGEEKESIVTYYFDQENFVPVRTEQEVQSGPGKGQIAITEYSDYQEVEGLYFAFSITQRGEEGEGQTIEFDEIEINPEVEDDFFSFPEGE